MMLKKTLGTLSIAITTAVIVSASAPHGDAYADLRMSDLFHSYSASAPGQYSTRGGNVWTGGSLQIRYQRPRVTLLNFNPPSANVGCGGLDLYGGAFGLISGDELTQVARGIAQGASTYFFKLALKSVCSGCEQAMSELQNTLNQFNDLARNTCERTEQALTGTFGSPEEIFGQQGQQRSGAIAQRVGEINSLADSMFNTVSGWAGSGTERTAYSGNSVVDAMTRARPNLQLGALGNLNLAGDTDHEKAISLMMTLLGTTVSSADASFCAASGDPLTPGADNTKCLIRKSANFSLKEAFFGNDSDAPFTLYSCEDNYAECLNVGSSEVTYGKSIYDYLQDQLMGPEGALFKIWNGGPALTGVQQEIIRESGLTIPKWFKAMKDANLDFDSVAEQITLILLKQSLDSSIRSMQYITNNIKDLKGGVYEGVVFGNDLQERAATLHAQFAEAQAELNERRRAHAETIDSAVALETLMATLQGGR